MGDRARRVSFEVQRKQMLEQIHTRKEDKNQWNQQRRILLVESLEQGRERKIAETEARRRMAELSEKMYLQCFGTTDLLSSDDSDDEDWKDDFDLTPAISTHGRRSSNVGPSNVGPSNVGPSNVGPSNVGPSNVRPSNDNALVVLPHDINRIVSSNIAQGVEKFPIPVFNQYGNDEPPGFEYIKENARGEGVTDDYLKALKCNCNQVECVPLNCICVLENIDPVIGVLNSGETLPYRGPVGGGRLIDARDIVFECSPDCECKETCAYQLSQNLKFHLEIFQTPSSGWGVRSEDYIARGDFVCEYVGELRNCNAALPNPYTLEIDCEQRIKGHRGKRISNSRTILGIWTLDKRTAEESSETPEFCIDSLFRGNVSRFINHSCEPNLFCQSVMYNHSANEKAIKVSRVVLFAKRDIPANEIFSFLSFHINIYIYGKKLLLVLEL